MEKRSRRRTRDLVTQAASQGLSQNKIACARISMMARSTYAPSKGRIQMRKTTPSICSHSACTARPVHTDGSTTVFVAPKSHFRFAPDNGLMSDVAPLPKSANSGSSNISLGVAANRFFKDDSPPAN
jgi:hypothetical protein